MAGAGLWAFRAAEVLMQEVPEAGMNHGRAPLIAEFDGISIPFGSAGLNQSRDPGIEQQLRPVGEREKRVARRNSTCQFFAVTVKTGEFNREAATGYPTHLASPRTEQLPIFHDDNRIAFDMLADFPRDLQITGHFSGRSGGGDNAERRCGFRQIIRLLNENSAGDGGKFQVPGGGTSAR